MTQDKFVEGGLKINVNKCEFLKRQVKFLGFMVGNGAMWISDEQKEVARNYRCERIRKNFSAFWGLLAIFVTS